MVPTSKVAEDKHDDESDIFNDDDKAAQVVLTPQVAEDKKDGEDLKEARKGR